MARCKDCVFYDEFADSLPKACAVIQGKEENEIHICPMFPDGIDSNVWNSEQECKNYISR